jgi:hypothetical protein
LSKAGGIHRCVRQSPDLHRLTTAKGNNTSKQVIKVKRSKERDLGN